MDTNVYGVDPISIEVLNEANEVMVSAGAPIDTNLLTTAELPLWDDQAGTLTLLNPVDLGTNVLMSRSDFRTNRPPPVERPATNTPSSEHGATNLALAATMATQPTLRRRRGDASGGDLAARTNLVDLSAHRG